MIQLQILLYRWHIAFVTCLFLAGCSSTDSGWGQRTDVFTCDAPDTTLTATFYLRQCCGAAGSQEEFVSLRLRAGGAESLLLKMGHGYNVRLTWLGPKRLAIGYPREANTTNLRKKFRKHVAGTEVDVELMPLDSQNGLLHDGNQCIGGRSNKPLRPTSGTDAAR